VDPSLRHVWLDKGEAFFDVKPDPAHPFVIHAGDHKVVVWERSSPSGKNASAWKWRCWKARCASSRWWPSPAARP
jgi:hypothetical protein